MIPVRSGRKEKEAQLHRLCVIKCFTFGFNKSSCTVWLGTQAAISVPYPGGPQQSIFLQMFFPSDWFRERTQHAQSVHLVDGDRTPLLPMAVRESRPLSDDLSVAKRAAKQGNDLPHFNLFLAWMLSLRTFGLNDWVGFSGRTHIRQVGGGGTRKNNSIFMSVIKTI